MKQQEYENTIQTLENLITEWSAEGYPYDGTPPGSVGAITDSVFRQRATDLIMRALGSDLTSLARPITEGIFDDVKRRHSLDSVLANLRSLLENPSLEYSEYWALPLTESPEPLQLSNGWTLAWARDVNPENYLSPQPSWATTTSVIYRRQMVALGVRETPTADWKNRRSVRDAIVALALETRRPPSLHPIVLLEAYPASSRIPVWSRTIEPRRLGCSWHQKKPRFHKVSSSSFLSRYEELSNLDPASSDHLWSVVRSLCIAVTTDDPIEAAISMGMAAEILFSSKNEGAGISARISKRANAFLAQHGVRVSDQVFAKAYKARSRAVHSGRISVERLADAHAISELMWDAIIATARHGQSPPDWTAFQMS